MEDTLLIIKPDGVKRKIVGNIISILEKEFDIKGIRMMQFDKETAERFYSIHKDKSFFPSLIEYMTSGPVVGILLSGENVIQRLREVVGATDPKKAEPGTIRKLYGVDVQQNTVHASDSPESARREIPFFFKDWSE